MYKSIFKYLSGQWQKHCIHEHLEPNMLSISLPIDLHTKTSNCVSCRKTYSSENVLQHSPLKVRQLIHQFLFPIPISILIFTNLFKPPDLLSHLMVFLLDHKYIKATDWKQIYYGQSHLMISVMLLSCYTSYQLMVVALSESAIICICNSDSL